MFSSWFHMIVTRECGFVNISFGGLMTAQVCYVTLSGLTRLFALFGGFVISYNCHYWSGNDPETTVELSQSPSKLLVWMRNDFNPTQQT